MAISDPAARHADRIQARAIRRCGELLKQFDGRGGDNTKKADTPLFGRADAANHAGLSEHQAKQAVRVANVPPEEFERQVESPAPPTVTPLAAEYDDAQDRGEVGRAGNSSNREELASVSDIGLTHKDIHEARQIRAVALPHWKRQVLPTLDCRTKTFTKRG